MLKIQSDVRDQVKFPHISYQRSRAKRSDVGTHGATIYIFNQVIVKQCGNIVSTCSLTTSRLFVIPAA